MNEIQAFINSGIINQCNFCQGMFIGGKGYAFINANGL
jgi:ribosomal protein L24E